MRAIDADALISDFLWPSDNNRDPSKKYVSMEQIRNALTIEPERETGEWIDDGDPLTLKCSKCGYVVARYNNTNFCPNCGSYNGAKMEVEG